MTLTDETLGYGSAITDFRNAHRKANLETLLAALRGESSELLPYEEVRRKLHATTSTERGLQEIPLDAIVGSVGRYSDFTRSFFPKQVSDEERWAHVRLAVTSLEGLPPIEVYKIGEAYFVKDGNHRVSVARELGATHIQAYVDEVQTKVPLTPDVKPDDLILKTEYADFLDRTHLDVLRPCADLAVTAPGKYRDLEEHIAVHRYFMGLDEQRDIAYEEAVAHWYDTVYCPIVAIIHRHCLLRDFPNRTEADLYLWLMEHRAALERELGWHIQPETAAQDLARQYSSRAKKLITRVGERLLNAIAPGELVSGPPPGTWRAQREYCQSPDRLFSNILVTINGNEPTWRAFDQALEIARREDSQLFGLHVVPGEAHKETRSAIDVEQQFAQRLAAAQVAGSFALETGPIAESIAERARWADLVVASLAHPPGAGPLAKLRSGFHTLIQRSPVPVLAVPQVRAPLAGGVLAYDGSPKAEEALYVATYLAARWEPFALTVVTVQQENRVNDETLTRARSYLEAHGVRAAYVFKGPASVAEVVLHTAQERARDLIIMGGYGYNAVLEVMFGSTLNEILRGTQRPVLICR